MRRSGVAERRCAVDWKARKKYPAEKIADGSFGGVEAEKDVAGDARAAGRLVSGGGAGDAGARQVWGERRIESDGMAAGRTPPECARQSRDGQRRNAACGD